MEKYCKNCGNYGHYYRNCRMPILSYGILLFKKDDDGVDKLLMIERKDSLSYIEFLRGKYKTLENIVFIRLLIDRFSDNEKKKILNDEFDILWSNLWVNMETINQKIKNEYYRSKELFYKLKEGYYINNEFIKLEDIVKNSKKSFQ